MGEGAETKDREAYFRGVGQEEQNECGGEGEVSQRMKAYWKAKKSKE